MTEIFFITQMDRLKRRFGPRHFDIEFIRLCSFEVKNVNEGWFQRAVDVWIGSRTVTKPPLLTEFRECRLNEDRLRLKHTASDASLSLDKPRSSEGLSKLLAKEYPGCFTLMEAIQLQIHKNYIDRVNKDDLSESKVIGKDDRESDTKLPEVKADNGLEV